MKSYFYSLIILITLFIAGCAGFNDPFAPSGGFGRNDSWGSSSWDSHNDWERRRIEQDRWELEQERRRVRDEQRRLDRERENQWNRPTTPPYVPPMNRPQVREERCPSGFSPSENKCSVEERRRGCKDMRLPGGLGCVKR
jgi:hypothetical protein